MKKCPWCGKKVPREVQICPSCGYDFGRGEMSSFYDQRQQKQAKSKIRHKNEMVIVATLAIIAGGSYIFNNHQEQTEARQNIQQTTRTISEASTSSSATSSSSSESSAAKSSSVNKEKKASSESKQAAKASSKKTESKKNIAKSSQSKKNVKKQAAKSSSSTTKKSNAKVAKQKSAVKKQATQKAKGTQLKTNMQPNEFAAAVANYAANKNVSKWKDVVGNSNNGILIRETTEPDIVNYLSAKGNGTVYVAFNSKDSNNEVIYSAYTINQDGSVNIYEFGTPSAPHTGNVYNPVETVSQQDMINYLNKHKQAKNVQQMAKKVGIAQE